MKTLRISLLLAATALLAAGQTLTTLHTFTNGSDGSQPYSTVVLRNGVLYGTCMNGGGGPDDSAGTLWSYTLKSSTFATIHAFVNGNGDAGYPYAGVVFDKAGNIYGTTSAGGSNMDGAVYRIAPDGTETILANFDGTSTGYTPWAPLVFGEDGSLYGTTSAGGQGGRGGVFSLATDGSGFGPLAFFDASAGGRSYAPLLLRGGVLFGTAGSAMFQFNPATSTALPLVALGEGSRSGLVADARGNLYGTTTGTRTLQGFVFVIAPVTHAMTILHVFSGPDGEYPQEGPLVLAEDGSLYGTTKNGGASYGGDGAGAGYGTVFQIDPQGNYSILWSFTGGADGAEPYGGLAMDSQGNLYGTTKGGGLEWGTVFEVIP
jgi:uncharacterized repeat protein (TIGR03803 family)